MDNFYVGMAKTDITPKLGTLLFGYPKERPAQKVMDNLFASALALKQNGETVIFISVDLCVFDATVSDKIITAICQKTGIKRENMLIFTTHTHSGPAIQSVAGWGSADMEYVESIIPKLCAIVCEALEKMQLAVMGVGTFDSHAGINRREINANGEVVLGQNPDGPYDPTMTAIVFRTLNGENIGTIIHFATHPTCASSNYSITRDWPGYMVDRVEKITSAPCIYINGAAGDIGPHLSNGKTTGGDEYVEEIGIIAANDAEKAVMSASNFKTPELKVITDAISLPLIELPSLEDVEMKIEAMGDPDKLTEVDITTYARLKKIQKMIVDKHTVSENLVLSQTILSLDNIAVVPFSFEVFCKIALSLSEKSPFDKTLLFGYSGGSMGYLPTEDQLPYGGYEIDSFRAATIPGFVDNLDKIIVEENVKLLNKLYTKK